MQYRHGTCSEVQPEKEAAMIRAVIFDLDNTLMDFMTMKENAIRAAVKAMIDAGLSMDAGEAFGDLKIRGFWVCDGYFGQDDSVETLDAEGWFSTGDVATIDADGFMKITDRTKDVIKSGGEWISSVELENEIIAHPDVAEAAVVGIPDEKWDERPLAYVVRRANSQVTPDELRAHLEGKVAKWWIPETWAFIDEIPKTSVGKFDKKKLRDRLPP